MRRPRIVIALDPERVSPEAIELGHALGLATGAPLTLLAVWRWWEPVELAMLAGQSLRAEADEVLRSAGDRLREGARVQLASERSFDLILCDIAVGGGTKGVSGLTPP